MLFLGISRIQNGFLFVLKIETAACKAAFRSLNMVGDTKKTSKKIFHNVVITAILTLWT